MHILKILILSVFFFLPISDVNAAIKKLYVICDEWPPYQILEGKRLSGFSTKVVETVFERMKTAIRPVKIFPWKRAITMIETGMADALFSANYTEERTRFAFYPEESIVSSPWVMWVREDEGFKFNSLNDLLGKKVGMVRGYSYTSELWNFVEKHNIYEEVPNDEINFRKLNAGRVDFIPAELGNGLHIVKKLKLNNIIPLTKNPVKTDGLYIIFNKNSVSRAFVDQFSDELQNLKKEPLYRDLYNEYFDF